MNQGSCFCSSILVQFCDQIHSFMSETSALRQIPQKFSNWRKIHNGIWQPCVWNLFRKNARPSGSMQTAIVFNSGSKCKSPLWTWLQFQKQETEIQDTQVRATHPTERTVSSLNRHIGTLSNVNHNCHLDCHGQLEINEIGTRK